MLSLQSLHLPNSVAHNPVGCICSSIRSLCYVSQLIVVHYQCGRSLTLPPTHTQLLLHYAQFINTAKKTQKKTHTVFKFHSLCKQTNQTHQLKISFKNAFFILLMNSCSLHKVLVTDLSYSHTHRVLMFRRGAKR